MKEIIYKKGTAMDCEQKCTDEKKKINKLI